MDLVQFHGLNTNVIHIFLLLLGSNKVGKYSIAIPSIDNCLFPPQCRLCTYISFDPGNNEEKSEFHSYISDDNQQRSYDSYGLVPDQDGPFFYTRSHLSALQNCALFFSINF